MIDVVIPASKQTRDFTQICLRSIDRQSIKPNKIILCLDEGDNFHYRSSSRIEKIYIKWESFAKAMNIGLKSSESEYVCLMNNDIIIPDRNIFKKQLKLLESDNKIASVGTKTLYIDNRIQDAGVLVHPHIFVEPSFTFLQRGKYEDYRKYSSIEDLPTSCNFIVVNKKNFGFFDENYLIGGYEDWDKIVELKISNYRLIYNGLSYVYHYEGRTVLSMEKNLFNLHRSRNHFYFRSKWIKKLFQDIVKNPVKWRAENVVLHLQEDDAENRFRQFDEELRKIWSQ
jgi:glycosyltransferase involved in cell wall biosynthesis